jgi:hypothetical protein
MMLGKVKVSREGGVVNELSSCCSPAAPSDTNDE